MSKLGLGKGLSSLLGSEEGAIFGEEKKDTVKLSSIEPNKNQPRKEFDQETIGELAESIKEHGLISPIVVREISHERYQIIAGERRYRACKIAKLHDIPVRIIEADDKKVAQLALIENLQREDLNPVEEAKGYFELMQMYKMTQEDVSKSVSKSRSAVANALRILKLSDEILPFIVSREISMGHARAILSVEDATKHVDFCKYIIEKGLNVRQAEQYAKKLNKNEEKLPEEPNIYVADLEEKMEEVLCRKVKIVYNKNKKSGKLVLEYLSHEDLEKLTTALSNINI